jgi:hypothetical protein
VHAVQCGINYIGTDSVDWFPRENGDLGLDPRGRSRIADLACYLLKQVGAEASTDRRTTSDPRNGWQCDYCGYVDACSVGAEVVEQRKKKRKVRPVSLKRRKGLPHGSRKTTAAPAAEVSISSSFGETLLLTGFRVSCCAALEQLYPDKKVEQRGAPRC